MRLQFFASLVTLSMALAGCSQESSPPRAVSPDTRLTLSQGDVIGFRSDNGARTWLGLPFAAPPVGDLRWRAPRPAQSWTGTFEAVRHGPRCAQLATNFDADEGYEPGEAIGSEDCLSLNVYAPAQTGDAPLPVMFWIHGGGNVWGRASQFDGSKLADQQGVIVVTTQYRLGPLGWFAHPALRGDAKQPNDKAANFALLDLIAGLGWVRDEIAAFGGDPNQVTVFGESAGGRNVAALLASPKAEGLFHRAIIQSGGFETLTLDQAEGRSGEERNASLKIAASLGAEDGGALRALSAEALLKPYFSGLGFIRVPQMIRDGVSLPRDGAPRLLENGPLHNTPIMIGSNRDEAKLFMAGDPRLVTKRLWMFPQPKDQEFYDAMASFLSRLWRSTGVDRPAQRMRLAGHDAVYAYRFDWDDGGSVFWTDTSKLFGAAHVFELPFVFNDFAQLGPRGDTVFSDETRVEREALAISMGRAWASFAKTGVPSTPEGPDWPVYGEDERYFRFDVESDGGLALSAGAETVEQIFADLGADSRVTAHERCLIVRSMASWRFGAPLQRRAAEALGCVKSASAN